MQLAPAQTRSSLAEDARAGVGSVRAESRAGALLRSGIIFLPLISAALWILTHAYPGIVGDAAIYIGRALADLDPNGLGRDLLFAHDGQSRFSLYPWLARFLVAAWGPDAAARALALSAAILWMGALSLLARCFLRWQHVWIVVAFVAVLPVNYGAPQRFDFSEMFAVPRPMAEALVLLALAALLSRRTFVAFAILGLATLVHPLMALAGWAVAWLALASESRRWLMIGILAGLALIAAACLAAFVGLTPFDRLFETIAPEVKALVFRRNALLFPTQWPFEFIGPMLTQMTTIAIAASLCAGRSRRLLLAAMVVGVIGITAQAFFGDSLSSLLAIQIQCWRMAWLTAAIGSFSLALCAIWLWPNGAVARVVLALLVIAWLSSDMPVAAGGVAALALVLHFTRAQWRWPITSTSVRMIWIATSLVVLYANANYFIGYVQLLGQMPAEASLGYSYFWNKRFVAFPVCLIVLALMLPRQRARLLWACRCFAACALAIAALLLWDGRAPFQRLVDSGTHPPGLMQAIAGRDGEVLWIGGLGEAWYLTGRPQWASRLQGVATIFSRELAIGWRDRMAFLRDVGLAERDPFKSALMSATADEPHVSADGLSRLCARPDAPAWVIAPLETGTNPLVGWPSVVWHAPHPLFKMTDEGDAYAWHRVADFLILPCAAR